jgi:hypothetical protein
MSRCILSESAGISKERVLALDPETLNRLKEELAWKCSGEENRAMDMKTTKHRMTALSAWAQSRQSTMGGRQPIASENPRYNRHWIVAEVIA